MKKIWLPIRTFLKCVQGGVIHLLYRTKKRKIFVIGLSRTGTNSITSALEVLDFKGHHYPGMCFFNKTPLWLKGNTLLKHDVFSDITVIPFYQYYYNKYPNSVFILTTRKKELWLDSLSKKPNLNDEVWRYTYKDKLREFLYGSSKYKHSNYSESYDQYHKSVRTFFETRDSSRFLELSVVHGEGWEKLCQFLDHPLPNVPFPHKNKGYKKKLV